MLNTNVLVACGSDRASAARYVDLFNELLPYYRITTLLRSAHFFAQLNHESARLKYIEEGASGKAYEGRISLGNIYPGDGMKYKGRGLIQITGRSNYAAFEKAFGVPVVDNPELLFLPRWAVASALWYWNTRRLNVYADRDDVYSVSCAINIGHVPKIITGQPRRLPNGWDDRRALLDRSKAALGPLFA